MKRRLPNPVLLFSVLLIFAASSSGGRAQEADELRRMITDAGDAGKYSGSGSVLVFDRTVSDVQPSGLAYVTQKRLWKVLAESGGLNLRAITFDYDPLSGHVEIKRARIIRKDGTVKEIAPQEAMDYPAPARAIYWGMRQVMLPIGRLEAGDGVYVESFKKGFTYALLREGEGEEDERFIPPMRGHFYDIVEFYSSNHVIEKSYTAIMPKDKPLQYEVYNGEVASSIRFHGDKVEYNWTKEGIEPFKSESNMVSRSDVGTKLLLSTSPDWIAKSLWFYNVNEDYGSFEVTPKVQAKVDELLLGVESDKEKVWILTHWVADNIRYSGISMGEGEGFTLHTGEMDLHDRCGDSKDKAGILITILRAPGFESYPAMTMAGSRIDYIPADQFNHCVTLIKNADYLDTCPGYGDYKLLDPTWVPFMRELWSSAEQQQNYLPGVPEGADLQITQLSPPENHYFRINGSSRLHADGELEGSFTLKAEGQSGASIRSNMVRRRMKAMWHEYFCRVMHAISPRAEIRSVVRNDPYDLSEPTKVSIEYRIPRYATVVGDEMRFVPCVAAYPFSDTASFLRMNLDLKERKYPFRARTSRLVELSETIELPDGFSAASLPSYGAVKGEAASFEGGYEAKEGSISFEARLELRKRIYDACDYKNFAKAVKGVKHMMDNSVVLGR